jgi:DNA-binding response OmpR family regulator
MANLDTKTLIFGEPLASKIGEIAHPKRLNIIEHSLEKPYESHFCNPEQPIVAIVDILECVSSQKAALDACVLSRSKGAPISIMGVLAWDTLRSRTNLELTTEQLAIFDDLLLLPAKAFEFDLRFAKLEQTAKTRVGKLSSSFTIGPITFDVQSMVVEVNSKHLRLTRKETEFLLFMARNADTIVSKERIAQTVWHIENPQPSFENVLNGHVSRLREKLGDAGCWGLLRTVRRVGLEFSLSAASFRSSKPALGQVEKTNPPTSMSLS